MRLIQQLDASLPRCHAALPSATKGNLYLNELYFSELQFNEL
jgi:hypothetical protein